MSNSGLLGGRRALITGGSGGLGTAMARAFADAGAAVAICGRNLERSREIASSISPRVHALQLELSQPEAARRVVRQAAELLDGLDIVVCAAGAPADGHFESIAAARWRDSFGVKFFGTVDIMREALPYLRSAGGGILMGLSGLMGREPEPGNIVSGAINAALENFMKALSREVAPDGIRVVTLCPGPFATSRIQDILMQRARDTGIPYDDVRRAAEHDVPLKRFGRPEEIARLAATIASDAGSFLTGTTITIDGGLRRAAF